MSLLPECFTRFGFEPKGIVHVGAHVGSAMSEYLAMRPALLVWIEADPQAFPQLQATIAAAGTSGTRQVAINALAADGDDAEREFYRFSNAGGSAGNFRETPLLRETWPGLNDTGEVLRLRSRRLQSVLAEQKISPGQIDVLVIDLQGAELAALRGAGPFLGSAQFIGVAGSPAALHSKGTPAPVIEDFLTALGFDLIAPSVPHADAVFRRVLRNRWEWASVLRDEAWCRFVAGGVTAPPLPPAEFQHSWCGSAGLVTFTSAMAFVRRMTSELARAGFPLQRSVRTLDFGCGWGRLYRLLMREVDFLVGADPDRHCITLCREMLPDGNFVQIGFRPPYEFADAAFDVVYASDLFLNLPETTFCEILREFGRIVAPGGYVAFNVVPTFFIDQWADNPEFAALLANEGGDRQAWKERAEAGDFLFFPSGATSGWAVISRACLARLVQDTPFEITALATSPGVPEFVLLRRTKA